MVLGAAACGSERGDGPGRECAGETGIEDLLVDGRAAGDVLAVVETEAGVGYWDEAGGSFARTELHRFGTASD